MEQVADGSGNEVQNAAAVVPCDTHGLGLHLGGHCSNAASPMAQQAMSEQTEAAKEQEVQELDAGSDLLGKRVLITGLVRAPEFNGQWGRVEAYDAEMQRYLVHLLLDMPEGEPPVTAKLRRENLVVPPTGMLRFEDGDAEAPASAVAVKLPPQTPEASLGPSPWRAEPAFVPFPQPLPAGLAP